MSGVFTSNIVHVPSIKTLSETPNPALPTLCEGKEGLYSPIIFGANNNNNNNQVAADNNKDEVDLFGQLPMFSNGGGNNNINHGINIVAGEKQVHHGMFSGDDQTPPLDYSSLEEIKELIGTSNSTLNIFGDESKMSSTYNNNQEEKVILYY